MSDYIEWVPKHHGHQPLHWTPDMLASVDGKNFVRQTNWAWIAGSTYYVPREAVGMVREAVEERAAEEMTDEELCGWLRSMLPPSGFAPAENWWAPWLGADRIEALAAEVAAYGRSLELKQALIEELKADNDMLRQVIARYQNVCGVLTQSDRDYLAAALEKQP